MRSNAGDERPHGAAALDRVQLGAYLDLVEVAAVLRHAVEGQLREEGGLSYVQFQLLTRLADSPAGSHTMTELADGVVYSRSGLTYQAGLLEQRGLVSRAQSSSDERSVIVTLTDAGRDLLHSVLPGHVDVVEQLFYSALPRADFDALAGLLAPLRDHVRSTPPRSAGRRRSRSGPG